MKFTIAIGILLAQVLPAISENNPSKLLLEQEGDFVIKNDHNGDHDFAALKSLFQKGKVLARNAGGTNAAHEHHRLDGLLKNVPVANMKACDPSSNDPDIGILSCDAGYQCVSDQFSTLGGVCSSITRDLQEAQIGGCDLCGFGSNVGSATLQYPLVSGTGETCEDLYNLAYITGTTEDQCNSYYVGLAQQSGCCVSYDCSICGGAEIMESVLTNIPARVNKANYTCGDIQGVLNPTDCASVGASLAATCCLGASAPGTSPSTAPVAPSPTVPDTSTTVGPPPTLPSQGGSPPPPASSASGKWSTTSSPLVMMSLTVVTAGSFLFAMN